MIRFRSCIALLLTLIWVPASMCCDLEAAGAAVDCCETAPVSAEPDACGATADNCCNSEDIPPNAGCDNVAESGDYQTANPVLKLAPSLWPTDIVVTALSLLEIEAETAPPAAWEKTRAPGWTTCWQFDRRTAPLAHAPDATRA